MNPDTVSHAFAYGLLQVIPKTGTLCALLFGEPDFGINELLEVDGSIRYGTWYLSQLLYKFHGQEMLAMVAYNAGPHQVQRWLEWRGDDMEMDEFIETVPYDGARRYPQRVLRYVSIFRAVNGLDREVYLGNELDDTFEDNIYF
jgi:soluble lytic murein transglycosylase